LRETAAIIQRGLRTEDVGARHGGEEFAVLLRYTDAPHGYAVAERIRREIEDRRFEHEGRVIRVTTSIGLATLEGRCYKTWQQMISAADGYLYKAKQQGRNRTHYVGLDNTARLTQNTISLTPEEFRAAREAEAGEPQAAPPAPRARKPSTPRSSRRGKARR
jgi:predicted signal transduction protein with EAL and GGDEF domain